MTYIDTSVILRLAFAEPGSLGGWRELDRPVTSRLTRIEALRTLDRRLAQGGLALGDFAPRRAFVLALLERMHQVELNEPVLEGAETAFLTPLRTLDALHLATALALARASPLVFATHDRELGIAALAVGLTVIGVTGAHAGARPPSPGPA